MFQIQQGIFWEYAQNFRRLPIYGFAHAKINKSIFISRILAFIGDIDILLNDFQSWFEWAIKILVKSIWVENPKNPGIEPTYELLGRSQSCYPRQVKFTVNRSRWTSENTFLIKADR